MEPITRRSASSLGRVHSFIDFLLDYGPVRKGLRVPGRKGAL
jgi:hypothetical protein